MSTRIDPNRRKPPVSHDKPAPPRITRQQRERKTEEQEYLAVRDIYLEQNPQCSYPGCGRPANQVHHIVRGTGGKARSRLNTDTFLGACSEGHHDKIEKMTPEQQIQLKQQAVKDTILRLRK